MRGTIWPAHIRGAQDAPEVQTLCTHSRNTAVYAAECLKCVELKNTGYLAGLIHDMGKCQEKYAEYIWKAFRGENVVRGSVNHTFAAARFLIERYHKKGYGPYGPLTAEILAYGVGSHHGLFDGVDEKHRSGLLHRMQKEGIGYEDAYNNFLGHCADLSALDVLFEKTVREVEAYIQKCLMPLLENGEAGEDLFYLGLMVRLVTSAVISGDRQDTAEFMKREVFPKKRSGEEMAAMWGRTLERVEQKLSEFPMSGVIQSARRIISQQCRQAADSTGGIYRLNVPTGAGKTLSALRFALAHSKAHGKSRIIFTSPLLSILEQNASVIREYVGDDGMILEHHSNVIQPEEESEELDKAELLMETWDSSPIIITTLVQLLNTMFSGKTSCIRRFHALCDCTIIIDEVQTVPSNLLTLFHLTISFLAKACNTTIVLCSATQPCAEAANHPIRLKTIDMVPYDPQLWQAFRRTKIINAGSVQLENFGESIEEILGRASSLLVICNKKAEAETIYNGFSKENIQKFYLSASMCIAHRTDMLARLREALKQSESGKILCVSTQVIEAGVDISFGQVIRLAAGMDSIVQAAGRCNRNRESEEMAPVWIVQCAGERLGRLPEIERGKHATQELLRAFQQNPKAFQDDLSSDEAIRYYYHSLYRNMEAGLQEGPVKTERRKTTLYQLLSNNADFADEAYADDFLQFSMNQGFRTAGRLFSVFDRDGTDILVPYSHGKEMIQELSSLSSQWETEKMQGILKKAKSYTVSVFAWQRDQLENLGGLISLCGGRVLALREAFYDENIGLTSHSDKQTFLEV